MKKKSIFLFSLAILTVLWLCSCSYSKEKYSNGTIDANQSNNYLDQGESAFVETHAQMMYMSFEECLSAATHIVSATYKGEYERHGIYTDLVFTLAEQYKGIDLSNEFHIRVCDQIISVLGTDIGYSTSANDYQIGETYLLVLEKHVSVYYPYDLYVTLGNIKITSDDAVMYDGTNVREHSNMLEDTSSNDVINSSIWLLFISLDNVILSKSNLHKLATVSLLATFIYVSLINLKSSYLTKSP